MVASVACGRSRARPDPGHDSRGVPADRADRPRLAITSRVADGVATAGEPGERCEREPLEPERWERRLDFLLELAREEREIEGLRDAAQHRPSLLGERDGRLEELLHPERGPDVDADERGLVAGVGEVVRHAGRDDDDVAGPRDDPLRAASGSASCR